VKSVGISSIAKRLGDLGMSVFGLIVLAPVMAITALLIRITMGRPVLFCQDRVGYHGKSFRIAKFRTMKAAFGADGRPLPDSERLTWVGRVVRQSSLDELPQLFNVLAGDMSFVGPRPLLPEYLPRYTPQQRRRHEVKPGITGWAQINGRNAMTWERRFELDVWYVDHRSLSLDLKIVFLTFWKVLRREGISQTGHVTMSEFMGSPAPYSEQQ
jgi:lipopolysaccharide/colanic/teichoic acid biosynthesis glycosyltransferase